MLLTTMDPTTTLFTFMLETHPSVQTVSLVGSWDNFSKQYAMERDVRRDRGQWRGCYNFKDIVCDGDRPVASRRNGGLKMGQPYYFYYEVDGSFETHDPSRPTTSACPYLPGQTVNMMWVPDEISCRQRSASLSSMRTADLMTMDPEDKFITPRPPPPIPDFLGPRYRLPTSHTTLHAPSLRHKRSDRSISPTPNWWSPRKLFSRKNSSCSQISTSEKHGDEESVSGSGNDERRASMTSSSSEGPRMSPEALRKFLSDDVPTTVESADCADRLELAIPDDIAEEEDDDFIASAVSDTMSSTILSPPPPVSRHSQSSSTDTLRRLPASDSSVTLKAAQREESTSRYPQRVGTFCYSPSIAKDETPTSRFSFSSDEASIFDDDENDTTSHATDTEIPSFYHSDNEHDDDNDTDSLSSPIVFENEKTGMSRECMEKSLAEAFKGYRLPQTSTGGQSKTISPSLNPTDNSAPSVVHSPPLLAMPPSSVVDDFVTELKQAGLSF